MPQIWLRPFMARNVVEDGRRVKVRPRAAELAHKNSVRALEAKRSRPQSHCPLRSNLGEPNPHPSVG
jgi:hypothetical protein